MDQIERFDFDMKPKKERIFLTPLAFLLSFPAVWKRHLKVNKVNMKGLKLPTSYFVRIIRFKTSK